MPVAIALLSAEEDSPLNHWHVMAGWTAGILIVFRLVWGFVGGSHYRGRDGRAILSGAGADRVFARMSDFWEA